MMMEIILPKISMIWFGNLLEVWSAMLIGALLAMAIGYRIGGILVKKSRSSRTILAACYLLNAIIFFSLPHFDGIFEFFLGMNTGLGSLLAALIVLLPSIGTLAITSPIIVDYFEKQSEGTNLKASLIFGASTFSGVFVILISGLYLLPQLGISFASTLIAVMLLLNVLLTFLLPKKA